MAVGREEIVALLQEKGVSFELAEHPPVYTIDEMLALKLPHPKDIAKNLFLRDDKKQNYYLIVLREDKKADLKKIRSVLSARPLRFASEEDLEALLGVTAVLPSPTVIRMLISFSCRTFAASSSEKGTPDRKSVV